MINRKSMTTKDWIIGMLLFSGIFALGCLVVASYAQTNNASTIVNNDIAGHYNNMQTALNYVNSTQMAVSQPGGLTLTGGLSIFATGMLTVLSVLVGSIAVIPNTIVYTLNDFGIDTTTGYIFLSILGAGGSILIIYSILNASKISGRA